jgi:hypothetical protein
MHDFRELILAHKGKRVCVIGGGPNLHVPKADIYISTNAHGVSVQAPDYILAMDEIHGRERKEMGGWLRSKSDAPIISPHGYADFRLGHWPQHPRFVLSGMIATWAAWAMGAKVVLLAGCDGYGGDPGYVDEARKMDRDVHCPVRVVGGGPLTKVWPEYDAKERFGKYKPHSAIDGLRGIGGMIRVRAFKPCSVGFTNLAIGQEMSAMRHDLKLLLKHRMVEEV